MGLDREIPNGVRESYVNSIQVTQTMQDSRGTSMQGSNVKAKDSIHHRQDNVYMYGLGCQLEQINAERDSGVVTNKRKDLHLVQLAVGNSLLPCFMPQNKKELSRHLVVIM